MGLQIELKYNGQSGAQDVTQSRKFTNTYLIVADASYLPATDGGFDVDLILNDPQVMALNVQKCTAPTPGEAYCTNRSIRMSGRADGPDGSRRVLFLLDCEYEAIEEIKEGPYDFSRSSQRRDWYTQRGTDGKAMVNRAGDLLKPTPPVVLAEIFYVVKTRYRNNRDENGRDWSRDEWLGRTQRSPQMFRWGNRDFADGTILFSAVRGRKVCQLSHVPPWLDHNEAFYYFEYEYEFIHRPLPIPDEQEKVGTPAFAFQWAEMLNCGKRVLRVGGDPTTAMMARDKATGTAHGEVVLLDSDGTELTIDPADVADTLPTYVRVYRHFTVDFNDIFAFLATHNLP